MKHSFAPAAALLLAAAGAAPAADWPQFRGPDRDGVYPGRATLPDFPADGPPVVWERPVGAGFSGPAAARGRVILFHRLGGNEVVESIAADDGETVWKSADATTYRDDFGFDEGPRATPVVAGGQIYTFGAQGVLRCLEFATGRTVWSLDTHREFGVRKGFFGAASTPLVLGSRLFANVGGSGGAGIVALDKDTGRLLWKATDHEASYSSPVAAEFEGETLVVFFTREGLAALDPSSGEVRFERRWRSRSRASVNAATPIVSGGTIFLSASYGTGAVALRVRGGALEDLWSGGEFPQQPLRGRRFGRRRALRISRPPGIRPEFPRGGIGERQGALVRRPIRRGHGDAGRRPPAGLAGIGRARPARGLAGSVSLGLAGANPACRNPSLPRRSRTGFSSPATRTRWSACGCGKSNRLATTPARRCARPPALGPSMTPAMGPAPR